MAPSVSAGQLNRVICATSGSLNILGRVDSVILSRVSYCRILHRLDAENQMANILDWFKAFVKRFTDTIDAHSFGVCVVPVGMKLHLKVNLFVGGRMDYDIDFGVRLEGVNKVTMNNYIKGPREWTSDINSSGGPLRYVLWSNFRQSQSWMYKDKSMASHRRRIPEPPQGEPLASGTRVEFAPWYYTGGMIPFTRGDPKTLWEKKSDVTITISD
jgi:hypothetical protein